MTGPNYPHPNPKPGSNAIGQFVIGVSPIGTIPSFDAWTTVISQYANSPILTQLIVDVAAYVDETQNMDDFYDKIWNIDTAQGWGLDVWGRILGVSRVLHIPATPYLGFESASPSVGAFGEGTFFSGGALTDNFSLSDPAFRTLLFAKALSNICDGSIPGINQILLNLFPNRGNCYVIDSGGMAMTYFFGFGLSLVEQAIVTQSGVLPQPCGVAVSYVQG